MPVSIAASITENSISVDNNSSSVTVKVKAAWTSGSFDHNPPKLTVTIDGVKYTKSVSLNPNNTTSGSSTIYSKTLISHITQMAQRRLQCLRRMRQVQALEP